MSESDSEVSLVSSNGTLKVADFDTTVQNLKDAAQDAIDTNDYLSYSTVLDIYLSEPGRYATEEKEALLQQLLDTLNSNHLLVYEVGWDIPALLVPFVDSEFAFDQPIRAAPCVYKVLKLFEVLALHGNAKELFLKATELLSTMRADESTGNPDYLFSFYQIKLYCVAELVTSTLRRIETLYPSRFLAMSVSSFINAFYVNSPEDLSGFSFLMKRLYGFARNYLAPPKPKNVDMSGEERKKIEEDENFLQRKLLTALLTEGVYMGSRLEAIGYTVAYFNHLHKVVTSEKRAALDLCLDIPVMTRLNELALSFDISPEAELEAFALLAEELVIGKAAEKTDEETFNGDLFEKLVVDFQETFANCILSAKTGAVSDSLGGNLLLYTYEACVSNGRDCVDVSLKQALSMTIRILVPGMVHSSLYHRGLLDFAVFWCWYAVHKLSKKPNALELELSSVPKVILFSFLQSVLHSVSSLPSNSEFRYLALTLLTKILSTSPEDLAYDFIIEALRDCPFKNAKPALVGILRVLMTSDRKVDQLSEQMNSLDLGGTTSKAKTASPPPLPTRNREQKTKIISLTEARSKAIFSLVDQHIELTFGGTEEAPQVNFEHLLTLLGLLNLLIPLRQSPLVRRDDIAKISEATEKRISAIETAYKGDAEKSVPLNAVTVLRVALTRLAE